jgi:hypothetical protein
VIDLRPFCSTSSFRRALMNPFSAGEHTYATNGHIAIRVSRRVDVPEVDDAPDLGKLFKENTDTFIPWRSLRKFARPEATGTECSVCHGRGRAHDCPDCTCTCAECDGTGLEYNDISMFIGEHLFNVKYVWMLVNLPETEVPESFAKDRYDPMPFRFTGGEGLLMGVRRRLSNHVDVSV